MPRMTMFRSVCLALLALGVVAGWLRPFAWSQDRKPVLDVTLGELMRNPGAYVGREVRFLCRFALHGSLYRREGAAFSEDRDLNFAVWDMHAPLWDEEVRKEVSPAFYMARRHPQAERMQAIPRYQAIEVTARVEGDYARIPWFRVEDVALVQDRAHAVDPEALTLFRRAIMAMEAGEYERAAGLLTQAHAGQLPGAYVGEIRSRLDQCMAHLGAGSSGNASSTGSGTATPAASGNPSIETSDKADRPPLAAGIAETVPSSPEEGEPTLLRAEAMRVSMIDVRAARAMVLQGQYVEAAHAYGRAIAPGSPLAGAGWLRKEIGQLYEKRYDVRAERQDLEIAWREYGKADEIAEGADGEARFLLARAGVKRGAYDPARYEAAERHARDAVRLQPDGTAARYLLAEVLAATNRTDEARRLLREHPVADAVVPVAGWMVRGRIAEADGFRVEALAAYRRVTRLEPESRVAWERIAWLCAEVGDLDAAAEAYASLVSRRPGHLPYRLSIGELLLRLGKGEEALEQLQYAMAAEGETGRRARSLLAAHALREARSVSEDAADLEPFSAMQMPKGIRDGESVPVTSIRMNMEMPEGCPHLPELEGAEAAPGTVLRAGTREDPSSDPGRTLRAGQQRPVAADPSPGVSGTTADADRDANLPDWAR